MSRTQRPQATCRIIGLSSPTKDLTSTVGYGSALHNPTDPYRPRSTVLQKSKDARHSLVRAPCYRFTRGTLTKWITDRDNSPLVRARSRDASFNVPAKWRVPANPFGMAQWPVK